MKKGLTRLFILSIMMFVFVFSLSSCNNKTEYKTNKISTISGNNTTKSKTTEQKKIDTTSMTNTTIENNTYYTITFEDYDGTILQTSSVKYGELPAYNKSNPSRDKDDNYSYSFIGWTPSITKVKENTVYTATYKSNPLPYSITINLDGGSSDTSKLSFKTDTISKDMLPFDITKKGYIFKGYELYGSKVYDENGNIMVNFKPSSSMTFKAIYEEAVTLTIYYTLYNPFNGQLINTYNEKPTDMGNVSETRVYNYNTYVDLFATPNEGYTFVGWFNEGQVLSNETNYKYMMWDEDFTMEARFTYTTYDLKVWSNNSDLGQVMIRNGFSQTFYNDQTLKGYYTQTETIVAYSKTDTRFLGWYNEKNELVSTNAVYTFNMINRNYTLEAKWNSFNVTYDLDGGVNSKDNPTKYNVDTQDIILNEPTKDGYTFTGWEYKDNIINKICTSNICHMSLKATWTANTNTPYKVEHYKENIDNSNYTLYETDCLTGTTDTLTNGTTKTYTGFKSPTITQVNINGNGETIIKLYYTRNTYTVTLTKNNDKAGTIAGNGTYKYDKSVTITATTNPGYTFNGWYKNDVLYTNNSSFQYTIETSNITFEARYTPIKYKITIVNQADGVTISGITSGNKYDCGSQVTLSAVNIPTGYTIKWTRSDGKTHTSNTYSFNVPSEDMTITTTTTLPYTREGNKIYFGTYPQSKVTDNSLINELNALSGTKPTSTNKYKWTDYNYYINSSVTSYMFYQDIDYDDDGAFDYRGVYFTSYRPYYYSYSSSTSNSCQDDNGYSTNTIYWFSYDPIEWNILNESNGKALIIANLILDSQEYCPNDTSSTFSHNGGTGYANNYELSMIRKFLNDNFYNTAFNDLEKVLIETTTVDNSVSSTVSSSNMYACNNTQDKLFLLSYQEATTYYSSNSSRIAYGTDYSKVQGLWVSSSNQASYWWLRSPDGDIAYCACYFDNGGGICSRNVDRTDGGVRPACYIKLQ